MNDYNLVLATLIATIANLDVNAAILEESKRRYEQGIRQEALMKEIIELLQSGK